MSTICVTGAWHQGVVIAACLADLGHDVRAVAEPAAVDVLAAGRPPVHEPELPELIRENVAAGRLSFTSDLAAALAGADVAYISTDTPVGSNDEPDPASVFALAVAIGRARSGDLVLCVTAQVPVGTTEELARLAATPAAYVPEFLRLGEAVTSFRHPDRVVIGGDTPAAVEAVRRLYEPLGRPIVVTDLRTAEMAKHAANAFLATSISFINELADLCGAVGADADAVAQILKLDRRIGPHAFLSPGLGFAGGTLGRELRALQQLGHRHGLPTRVLDAVSAVNDARPQLVRAALGSALGEIDGRRIVLLGLTYKAGTNTLRRAVSLEIASDLLAGGASVTAYDPSADLAEVDDAPALELYDDPYAAARGCAAAAILTEPNGWRLDLSRLRAVMAGDVLLDARAAVAPADARAAGFRYVRLGARP